MPKECRLNEEDAQLVVGLHTDGGGNGFPAPFADIDFFPNNGTAVQPGCENSDNGKV